MNTENIYTENQSVLVLVHDSKKNKASWLPGKFIATVVALDRDYRVTCVLNDGRRFNEAAPECVKAAPREIKYLSAYTEAGITEALDKFGGFYSFSKEQFNASRDEKLVYVSLGSGLVAPAQNAVKLTEAINEVGTNAVAQDIRENGIESIIMRELANHEAYYTGEIDDTCDALEVYGITAAQVQAVYNKCRRGEC